VGVWRRVVRDWRACCRRGGSDGGDAGTVMEEGMCKDANVLWCMSERREGEEEGEDNDRQF